MCAAEGVPAPSVIQLLEHLLGDADRLGMKLAQRILASQPAYASTPDIELDQLRDVARRNLAWSIRQMAGSLPPELSEPAEARATGRLRAQQGIPLEAVLSAYRLGGQLIWEEMLAVHRGTSLTTPNELLDAANWVWQGQEIETTAVIAAYREEAAHLQQQDVRRQQFILDGLLSGRGSDLNFAREASRVLNLPETGRMVCVVALRTGNGAEAMPDLPRGTAEIRSAWGLRGEIEMGLVLQSDDPDRLLHLLRRHARGRIGVSPEVEGIADAPRAYRLAELAARTARDGEVITLPERLPEALLVAAGELTPLLSEYTLRSFDTVASPERAALIQTLDALISSDWSPSRAAGVLHCHRNTVTYRLARIQKLYGSEIGDARAKLLWTLAVLADGMVGQ